MESENLKVLFVEDNEEDLELSVLELKREGFEIVWKRVETEAGLRSALTNWLPDLIISDYSMPAFNGILALEIVQELVPEIPFIFVSGTIGEDMAIEAIIKGATDYVLKDNLRRLSTSVRRALKDAYEKQRTLKIEQEKSRLATILETTSDLVAIADPSGHILYLNQGGRQLLDLQDEITALSIKDMYTAASWSNIENQLHLIKGTKGIWQAEIDLSHKDGTKIPASLVVISHKEDDDEIEFFSFIARDLRERRDYEKKIDYLANFNPVTGMPNRSFLTERAEQAIYYSQWTNHAVMLLIIDIDQFKMVNDAFGSHAGDELLKQFGDRLKSCVKSMDTIAHLNVDTFAMIVTELINPEDVISIVSKLQNNLKQAFFINEQSINITTRIGISSYPRDAKDAISLIQNADIALHRSKEIKGDLYQFYASEMAKEATEKIKLENELRNALSNHELELYFQPKVSLEDRSLVGVEALIRWNHPEKGLLSPAIFIPIMENSDLIHSIGEWVLETACKLLKYWHDNLGSTLKMAVNVSVHQFLNEGFTELLEKVLRKTGLEPQYLELEITERTLVHDHNRILKILAQLKILGVKIALDDFGTGYSNLSYLSRQPIDYLKIDQSFVKRSMIDPGDAEIVRAVISLANSLGMLVIAEGIETEEQLDFLQSLNCHEGQGFLFSKPIPEKQITKMLSANINHFPLALKKMIGSPERNRFHD